jgi:DNA-binding transcriptional regulator YiaG
LEERIMAIPSLRRGGWTKGIKTFAHYAGIGSKTVGRWRRGENEIPGWVDLVLKSLEDESKD